MTPLLSILIAAREPGSPVEACLVSIEAEIDERVEVIVADGSQSGLADRVEARFPWAHVLRCPPLNAGELRREAFAVARGQLIALAEPHVTFGPGWVNAALATDRYPAQAIGGAVVPGPAHVRGTGPWAAFLCEYADFLPPLTDGPTPLTTGNNVVYPRTVVELSDLRSGVWKNWINDGITSRGGTLWSDSALVVRHERSYHFGTFLTKRFHYGRCYGSTRAHDWPWTRRLARALSTPLLPLLFSWRVTRAVLPKRRYLGPLIMSQPLLLLFHIWWAAGEGCGYLAGAGGSCAYVY